jgi:hypothetical protein
MRHVTRQQEALGLATEVIADFELSRTTTVQRPLKTLRVARLLDDLDAQRWVNYEQTGVPNNEDGRRWMRARVAGRRRRKPLATGRP